MTLDLCILFGLRESVTIAGTSISKLSSRRSRIRLEVRSFLPFRGRIRLISALRLRAFASPMSWNSRNFCSKNTVHSLRTSRNAHLRVVTTSSRWTSANGEGRPTYIALNVRQRSRMARHWTSNPLWDSFTSSS